MSRAWGKKLVKIFVNEPRTLPLLIKTAKIYPPHRQSGLPAADKGGILKKTQKTRKVFAWK
jgi:hypothetical protein